MSDSDSIRPERSEEITLPELVDQYKHHNACLQAAQAGLSPKQARIKTGKDCLDCGCAVWSWERVCKECGKTRLKQSIRADARDQGLYLSLVHGRGGS